MTSCLDDSGCSDCRFTNYHEYLDQPIADTDSHGKKETVDRIFSPKEETKARQSQLVALAAPGAGSLVLADIQGPTAEQDDIHDANEHQLGPKPQISAPDILRFELNGWWHGEVYYTSGNLRTTRTF